ncbi:MAG TPA: SRPBCC family protein [Puia sp.]
MIALYIILGLIALILIVAAAVGTGWSYEKSINIQAPPGKVWGNIDSLSAINKWNPWVGRDPHIKLEYSGADGTPGAKFSWESDNKNVGAGSQTITKVTPGSELASRIDFLRPFKGTGQAYIRVKEDSGATTATWGIISSSPYPMNILKVFGVIEKNMNKDFTEGLNKLKEICEH